MSRRLAVFFCLFALCSLLLFFRTGGIVLNDSLQQTANTQSRYTLTFGETRGKIYDCRMRTLVDEETEYLAACLPTPENMVALLANAAALGEGIGEQMEGGKPFLTKSTIATLDIEDVSFFAVEKRNGEKQLARHVIGYLDSQRQGVTGIEKAYDAFLSAKNASSSITYTVDGMQSPLPGIPPQIRLAPVRTGGVVLALDRRIQSLVEEAGNRYLKKGAIVVMEPSTGKLRAVASFPGYTEDTLAQAVGDEENAPLLNRAFSAYNVGSTFKIVTAAEALEEKVTTSDSFFCSGKTEVFGQVFRCHEEWGHGELDLRRAMMTSCNPYFIQLGLTLQPEGFLSMAQDLSFGKASLLAEGLETASGVLPELAELSSPAAVGNLSFGQGSLTATPVQIARMMSAILNGGVTPEAMLVEGTTQDGKLIDRREEVPAGVKAMDEQTARTIQEYLIDCVMEEPNQNARPRYVTAGGKTGTAQTGQYGEDGEEKLNGWFAGFFPAEEPQYVVVVLAEEARSGNQDASPVFRAIADALHAPIQLDSPEE